jgi:hypothetical protein
MNLGAILDRAINILRARFAVFAGIAVFPGLLQLAFQLASVHPKPGADASGAQITLEVASYAASFALWVLNVVAQAIATAAICLVASRVQLGDTITFRAALGSFKCKGGRLVWLGFLQGIYAGWPLVIAAIISVAVGASGASIFVQAPIWILGVIPCIALYSRCALAFPASAIEDLSANSAFGRSIKLSEGGRWRVCGGFIFPGVASVGFFLGSAWLILRLKALNPFLDSSPFSVATLNGVVSLLGDLVFIPLSAIVLTVLYYDQRIRREGYDVERMMEKAGLTAPLTPPSGYSPVPPAAEESRP